MRKTSAFHTARSAGPVALSVIALALSLAGFVGVAEALREPPRWELRDSLAADDFRAQRASVVRRHGDRIWIGTEVGLAWTEDQGRSWVWVDLSRAGYAETPSRLSGGEGVLSAGSARARRRNTVTGMALDGDTLWVGTLDGLAVSRDRGSSWASYGRPHGLGGAVVTAVGARGGLVCAATTEGLFLSRDEGETWHEVRARVRGMAGGEGVPRGIRHIEIGDGRRGLAVWLAGFDAPQPRGTRPDFIRSEDSGTTWEAVSLRGERRRGEPGGAHVQSVHVFGAEVWAGTRDGLARSRDFGDTWETFDSRSGLPPGDVFCLARRDGRMWAGTADGVSAVERDGLKWEQVRGYYGPVTSLAEGQGALWLATEGGLLKRTHGGAWTAFGQRKDVLSLAVTRSGTGEEWWAGTRGGLCVSRDRGRSWRILTVSDGMPGNVVRALAPDGRGGVWAATEGGVAHVGRNRQVRAHTTADGLRSNRAHDIAVDGDFVWVATERGLARFDQARSLWMVYQPDIRWLRVAVSTPHVYATTTDWRDKRPEETAPPARPTHYRPGETYLVRGDVDRSGGERWRHLTLPGHDGGPMNDLGVSEHVAWVATSQGLYRSKDQGETWARFERETLWGDVALQVFPLDHSEWGVYAYLGEFSPLFGGVSFTRDFGRRWQSLSDRPIGEVSAVRAAGDTLLCGARNGLWVREAFREDLRSERVGRLGWLRLAHMNRADVRPDHTGHIGEVDPYGFHGPTLWVGSRGGGLLEAGFPAHDKDTPFGRGQPASWHPHRKSEPGKPADGLSSNDITALSASPDALWVGTALGLSALDRRGNWRSWYTETSGLSDAPVTAVAYHEGEVWVGTRRGVDVYDPGSGNWRRPVLPSDWPSENIRALRSSHGELWVGTGAGACVLQADGEWAFPLKGMEVYDIQTGRARTYFGTSNGLYGLDRGGAVREHRTQRNSALTSNSVYRVLPIGGDVWALTQAGIALVVRERSDGPCPESTAPSERGPEGVVVVANKNDPDSVRLAERYAEVREIPATNICLLDSPTDETVSREVFEERIRKPLRGFLIDRNLSRRASFIVLMRGMPLAVQPAAAGAEEMAADAASVDSELVLLARPHVRQGPLPNPYLYRDEPFDSTRFGMYLVTRLDGPDLADATKQATVPALVESQRSFASRGFAYFDLDPGRDNPGARVNEAILSNYEFMRRDSLLRDRLRVNREAALFDQPNQCPAAFFYLGWHSNVYLPRTFSWLDGAVGMHIHANSARTLRDPRGSWLAGALGDGLTAGIGTVRQPGILGVNTFENIYRYLHSGYTWAESAYMSTRYISWQTVVVGDPLYTPFP